MIWLPEILYVAICLIEAKLEQYIIAGKRIDISGRIDALEHAWSAVYSIAVGASLMGMYVLGSGNYDGLLFLVIFPVLRRLFFNFPLKVFRGLADHPLHIIDGNGPVDRLSRGLFGAHGGYKEIVVCMALISAFNCLMIKFIL